MTCRLQFVACQDPIANRARAVNAPCWYHRPVDRLVTFHRFLAKLRLHKRSHPVRFFTLDAIEHSLVPPLALSNTGNRLRVGCAPLFNHFSNPCQ